MNTEITNSQDQYPRGWLAFDGECAWCSSNARSFAKKLASRGVGVVPLRTSWVRAAAGISGSEAPRELLLLTPDGKIVGGADALLSLARHFWWARPFRRAAMLPGATPLLRRLYAWAAARRHCLGGSCQRRTASISPSRQPQGGNT